MVKKIALYGMYVTLAFVFSYIEHVIMPVNGIPGIKLGLANVVVVTALYIHGVRTGMFVNIVRIILAGLLFGNLFGIIYSMAGGMTSFIVMVIMKKTDRFSIKGVSVTGGVMHNIAQIVVASVMLKTKAVFSYLPVLIIAGTIMGVLVGVISSFVVPAVKKYGNN